MKREASVTMTVLSGYTWCVTYVDENGRSFKRFYKTMEHASDDIDHWLRGYKPWYQSVIARHNY